MKFNPKAFSQKPIPWLRLWVGGLLLIYVFIYIVPPGLVPHSEHEHLGQIGTTIEKDPCHITIYHPNVEGGCHHKYHFTNDPGDCLRCHVSIVRQIVPEPIQVWDVAYYIPLFQINCPTGEVIQFPILHDDRGPPSSSII
ncbi:MAG TPA: hypothetical protein VFG10_15705 [Saprospiraceae bacterium]|nr:hypothetical protein [Saprospiraceae bacterium]